MPKAKTHARLTFQERQEIILEAGRDLFSQKGFVGTTTKAIALKAKINEALLFRHFATKEELYTEILRRKMSRSFSEVIPLLGKNLSKKTAQGLFNIAKTFIREHVREPRLFRMMLYSALENHRVSRFIFRQRVPFVTFVEEFLRAKAAVRELRPLDARVAARAFIGMIHNYIMVTQIFKTKSFFPKSEDRILKEYIHLFLKGVGA
ncbi:MAG: TetR/AcrR family transcriptional regulator [bacterium]